MFAIANKGSQANNWCRNGGYFNAMIRNNNDILNRASAYGQK